MAVGVVEGSGPAARAAGGGTAPKPRERHGAGISGPRAAPQPRSSRLALLPRGTGRQVLVCAETFPPVCGGAEPGLLPTWLARALLRWQPASTTQACLPALRPHEAASKPVPPGSPLMEALPAGREVSPGSQPLWGPLEHGHKCPKLNIGTLQLAVHTGNNPIPHRSAGKFLLSSLVSKSLCLYKKTRNLSVFLFGPE